MKFCLECNVEFYQTSDVLWNQDYTGISIFTIIHSFQRALKIFGIHLFVVDRIRKTSAIQNPNSNCAYCIEVTYACLLCVVLTFYKSDTLVYFHQKLTYLYQIKQQVHFSINPLRLTLSKLLYLQSIILQLFKQHL